MTTLTAVNAVMASAVRRTCAFLKSMIGQSVLRLAVTQLLASVQADSDRDEQQSQYEQRGDGHEDHQARVRVLEHSRQLRDQKCDEHHGRRRGDDRTGNRERVAEQV